MEVYAIFDLTTEFFPNEFLSLRVIVAVAASVPWFCIFIQSIYEIQKQNTSEWWVPTTYLNEIYTYEMCTIFFRYADCTNIFPSEIHVLLFIERRKNNREINKYEKDYKN